jgi:hypothetical protein
MYIVRQILNTVYREDNECYFSYLLFGWEYYDPTE